MTILLQNRLVVGEATYSYDIIAQDFFGRTDSAVHTPVTVVVLAYKKTALRAYFVASFFQTQLTALGLVPFKGYLLIAEGLALASACLSYHTAIDPDPNFTELASLELLHLPTLDALPASAGKRFVQAWQEVLVDYKALSVSLGRYEGAKAAGSQEWMLRQLVAARQFHAMLMEAFAALRSAMIVVIAELEAEGVTLTAADLAAAKTALLNPSLTVDGTWKYT